MGLLSILVIAFVFDSVDGIVDLEIYIRYAFSSAAVLLILFAVLYSFRFFPKTRSELNGNIRFSIIIVRNHFMVFLAVALFISVMAYLVFVYLARNQSEKVDANLLQIAKMQIKLVNNWRDRQAYLFDRYTNSTENVGDGISSGKKSDLHAGKRKNHVFSVSTDMQSIYKLSSLAGSYDLVKVLKYKRVWMGPPKRIQNANGKWIDVLTMCIPFMETGQDGGKAEIRTQYIDSSDSLIPMLSVWPTVGTSSRLFLFSNHGKEIVILRNSLNDHVVYPLKLSESRTMVKENE